MGDVAYRDEEGFVYICDRKKDMIISGGVNIYPAEIEAVLHAHDDVMDAAVFGVPSDEWGEAVHAVVAPRPGHTIDLASLEAYSDEHLAGYKRPRSWEVRGRAAPHRVGEAAQARAPRRALEGPRPEGVIRSPP